MKPHVAPIPSRPVGRANLTLLMGEMDILDRLETKGMVLITYNRYVDDITTISDVKEKNEKVELFRIIPNIRR